MCSSTLLWVLRRKNGLTQRQVAEHLHMDRSTYAYYELGQTKPTIEFLIGLAHLYNVSLDSLLNEPPAEAPRNRSDMLFSQLSYDEKKLVILCRAMSPAQRESLLAQGAAPVK